MINHQHLHAERESFIRNISTTQDVQHRLKLVGELLSNDRKVWLTCVDIDGIHRGKTVSKEKFLSAVKNGGFGFCSVVFGWDCQDDGYEHLNNHPFPDLIADIDLSTFSRIPWDNNLPLFIVDFPNAPMCPRRLLRESIDNIRSFGFEPMVGLEFEWFNYLETPSTASSKNYQNLTRISPGMFGYSLVRPLLYQDYFNDLYDLCEAFGHEIEGIHTETGPGVYEVALKYDKALKLADNAQLFKLAAKQIGQLQPKLHGTPAIYPCFMAKPSEELPGNSGHVHLSLFDKEGKNVFYDEKDENGMSEIFKKFICGILYYLPDVMPMYAPNINSYKRYNGNFWAPLTISWGLEDRLSAIRIITPKTTGIACSAQGTRAELRVPGSDINSYLAIAAALSSGIYGIKQDMKISDFSSDKKNIEILPKTLEEAVKKMKSSSKEPLFKKGFQNHFLMTRDEECKKWNRAVTIWETERYFETT